MHILCIMKVVYRMTVFLATLSIALASVLLILHRLYRRPYLDIVEQCGVEPALIYAIMKAESGFDESAVSKSGAIGLMQLMPSTAEFVGVKYALDRQGRTLYDGRYNVTVGCLYVKYLLERFPDERTAVCAYNAGEGNVSAWLRDPTYSDDGVTLQSIPYAETRCYEKKVYHFKKNYQILYQ